MEMLGSHYGCCQGSTEGRADTGSHMSRVQWAHQVTAAALQNQAFTAFKEGLEADNLEGKKVCRHGNQPPTILILEQNSDVRNPISPVYASTRCSHCYHFPGLWRHSLYAISAQATLGRQASGCRMGLLPS